MARPERLVGLCKIWGAAKFFHPYLAYRNIDWDAALIDAIPRVKAAQSSDEYAAAIGGLLAHLDDPATRVVSPEEFDMEAPAEDPPPATEALKWSGGVAALRAAPLTRLAHTDLIAALDGLVRDLEGAESIVVDLRGAANYLVLKQLEGIAPRFLDGSAQQPSTRTRMHSGYTTDGAGSGGYSSGFYVTHGLVVQGAGGPLASKPLAFVVDAYNGVPGWVSALQAAGRARIVFVGDPESSGPLEVVELPEGVRVLLRTGELIQSDGTLGVAPDVVLEDGGTAAEFFDTSAGRAAVATLTGDTPKRTERRLTAPVNPYRREKRYEDTPFPSLEHRLLALFRYWTVMDLFFPYKQHLDRPWEEVLAEGIPSLEAAGDETEYALALAAVIAQTRDTHCFLYAPAFQRWIGTHAPAMRVRLVEDRTVVVHLAEPVEGMVVGDVVLSVDGEAAEARRDRLRPYISASTPQAMEWRLHNMLLNGAEGSDAILEIERTDGTRVSVSVPRTQTYVPPGERDTPTFGVLPSGFGYFDLARLMVHEVDDAFEAVRGTPGLIIDDRCYPNGTAWAIAPRFAEHEFVGALFRRPEPRSPSPTLRSELEMKQTLRASDKWRYDKPVVVLINGEAISQAEHTCLLIDAACKPTFVGSATNGANGDVTSIQLPGGVRTMFSGHDVRHADGRQLQRIGVQPDVEVHPTVKGLRAGRDEVLDAAIEVLAAKV